MIHVFKGLKLGVAAAIISAILFYGALTFIISTPTQTLAAKALEKTPTTLRTTITPKTTVPELHAKINAETIEGVIERKTVFEYGAFIQNLLISLIVALAIMAIFRIKMR